MIRLGIDLQAFRIELRATRKVEDLQAFRIELRAGRKAEETPHQIEPEKTAEPKGPAVSTAPEPVPASNGSTNGSDSANGSRRAPAEGVVRHLVAHMTADGIGRKEAELRLRNDFGVLANGNGNGRSAC